MLHIPLQAVSNQTLAVTLARQPVQITLRQIADALYLDVAVSNRSIVRTRICRDRQRLLLDAHYRGFVGELAFVDTQGTADPQFEELGTRYRLFYLSAAE
jgi:hypothetical protein